EPAIRKLLDKKHLDTEDAEETEESSGEGEAVAEPSFLPVWRTQTQEQRQKDLDELGRAELVKAMSAELHRNFAAALPVEKLIEPLRAKITPREGKNALRALQRAVAST